MPSRDPDDPPARPGRIPASAVRAPARARAPVPIEPEHLYKAAALLFLLALVLRYFPAISHVLLIAYGAAILAVALNVVVALVPGRRSWVTAAVGVVLVAAVGAALWFGARAVAGQVRGLAGQAPAFEATFARWGEWVREQTGLNVGLVSQQTRAAFRAVFTGLDSGEVLGRVEGVLEWLAIPLLILFGGLFAVGNPNDRLLQPVLRAVPRERRAAFRRLLELLGERLRGWVKGTLLAMLAVGLLTTASLYLIGVRYALLLGLINGLTEAIPILGPWLGGAIGVAVALLDSPEKAGLTALAMAAIQQVEANLITPMVMSRAADVHPFVTLFALILFGSVFGFLGILLAVPLVLFFWTVVEVLWVERAIDTDEDRIEPVVKE